MRLIGLALILTLSLILAPLAAEAQRPSEVRRIGYLQAGVSGLPSSFYEILREGLRDLGYVEGRNIIIECSRARRTSAARPQAVITPSPDSPHRSPAPVSPQHRISRQNPRSTAQGGSQRCG